MLPRSLSRPLCAVLLSPYFLVLFLSLYAPDIALPIPAWGEKKPGGPLGAELSPSLRLPSPHRWPHPVWAGLIGAVALCLLGVRPFMILVIIEGLGVPLLRAELHEYLKVLDELPEQGFVRPTFGIVHGWRTMLYSFYLNYVARCDVRDFGSLRAAAPASRSFLPADLPPRLGSRPEVPLGLPQRQADQRAAEGLEMWSKLVDCPPGNLPALKERQVFTTRFDASPRVAIELSPNEGAGAKALICMECKRPEVARMASELAHEHSADRSWHAILSATDAHRVCELGWAERGPPIVCKCFFQPGFIFAPEGWVFLYAPRDADEVEILAKIVGASHAFASSSD